MFLVVYMNSKDIAFRPVEKVVDARMTTFKYFVHVEFFKIEI